MYTKAKFPYHLLQQGFDGLALGTAFARANFSNRRYILFASMFVLVTPLGIALGMGISTSYAPGSKAALGSEAVFNSISAGKHPDLNPNVSNQSGGIVSHRM